MRMSRHLGLYSGLSSPMNMYPPSVTFTAETDLIKWTYYTPAQSGGNPYAVNKTTYIGRNDSGNWHVSVIYITTPTFKGTSDSFIFRLWSAYHYNTGGLPIAWQLCTSDANLELYRTANYSVTPPDDKYAIAHGTSHIPYKSSGARETRIEGNADLKGDTTYVMYVWSTSSSLNLASFGANDKTNIYMNISSVNAPILSLYDTGETTYSFDVYGAKYDSDSTRDGNNIAVTMNSSYMTVGGNTYGTGMAYVSGIDLTPYTRIYIRGTMHVNEDYSKLAVWSSVGEYISDNMVASTPLNETYTVLDISNLTGKHLIGVTNLYIYTHKISEFFIM